jgi:ABC-type branched-subunit amino acid transport system substrate-binding protein
VVRAAGVRIGVLLPLSGGNAAIGRALLDAAQLALFDAGDDRIALLPRDTGGTASGAAQAAQAALDAGAQLIIGPLTAGETAAVAPVAGSRGVNVMAFSSDRSVAGNGVYILGFTPEEQVDQVVRYARGQGLEKFAALTPENAYGAAVLNALKQSLQKYGGDLARQVSYPAAIRDFGPYVQRLSGHGALRPPARGQTATAQAAEDSYTPPFQALMLAEGDGRLKALAPILPYYAIDPAKVRFLGNGLWDEPGLGAEHALIGGWYAAAPPTATAGFAEHFAEVYDRKPPRIASLGYDAMALAAVLAKTPDATPFSREALDNPNGFAGYDGIFRFGPDGVAQRGLAILQIEAREVKVIDPAPQSFQPLTQ